MKKTVLTISCLVSLLPGVFSQNIADSFWTYTDFHIHPTYKHYFREKKDKAMRDIIANTSFNSARGSYEFAPSIVKSYGNDYNWKVFENANKNKNLKQLRRGDISNLRNYDQASYPEIMFTPGSILCDSYSPYEKQFAYGRIKRLISSLIVTKMGYSRLTSYSKQNHSPFDDFLAEYYYNQIQSSVGKITQEIPQPIYLRSGERAFKKTTYYNIIKIAANADSLYAMLQHNDSVFMRLGNIPEIPTIYTPMYISIEGAQVLYGKMSCKEEYILHPLRNDNDDSTTMVQTEILDNVKKLKNLPHRLLFITLGHFAQNHVVGYAKTLDRDPDNFQHRFLSTLTKIPKLRNNLIKKNYAGFNDLNKDGIDSKFDKITVKGDLDSLGFRVVRAFLDTGNSFYKKPTYIDVKHMDIKARVQYYYYRRKMEQELGIPIPIIASHFGVSGEKQAMAAATGLWPNFDRYSETETPYDFYRNEILRKNRNETTAEHWSDHVMNASGNGYNHDTLDRFEKAMYKPLNFGNETEVFNDSTFNPFEHYDIDKDPNIGWFYPWSINLFDEEIIEVNKSGGIIGLLMDPRQLGAYMPRYKQHIHDYGNRFEKIVKEINWKPGFLELLGIVKEDLNRIEYMKCEPLLRNIFYIVRLVKNQQDAEAHQGNNPYMQINHPSFIKDTALARQDGWNMISIGSDYDGLIDPIDIAPTAAYIPLLQKRLIVYAYVFALMHADEFHEPGSSTPLINSPEDSKEKMRKIFYLNGRNFVVKYF
jgi:hypothetical protein